MLKVLDVGCGTGENCFDIGKRRPGVKVIGIDPSFKNIDEAKKKFGSKNVSFIVGEGEILPFEESEFDEVYLLEVLEHVSNPKRVLKECLRVLGKNGRLILTFPNPESEMILSQMNKRYLRDIGHERKISMEDFLSYLPGNNFILKKYEKYNSSEHLFWKELFKRNYVIIDENGNLDRSIPRYLVLFSEVLNQGNLFNSSLKRKKFGWIFYFLAIIFYPLSRIMDYFFVCKRQKIVLTKK